MNSTKLNKTQEILYSNSLYKNLINNFNENLSLHLSFYNTSNSIKNDSFNFLTPNLSKEIIDFFQIKLKLKNFSSEEIIDKFFQEFTKKMTKVFFKMKLKVKQ